jgi:acyl-CoA thioester hydrolase
MRRGVRRIDPSWDQESIVLPVRFNEVDSMKIVWHGNYVAYCECAREAFLAARGLSYTTMDELGCPAPVVRMSLEYLRPALGGDLLTVICAHVPGGEPKLECCYEVRNQRDEVLCTAESLQIFVDRQGQVLLSAPPAVERLFRLIATSRAARISDGSAR